MANLKPTFPQLQRGNDLSRGLLAAYGFYEGSGGKLYDLVGSNDGTWSGTGTRWAGGPSGWLGKFNASDDRVALTGLSLTAYTVEQWLLGSAAIAGAAIKQSLINGTSASWGFSWDHTNANFQRAWFHQKSDSTFLPFKLATSLSANVWYHIVYTWDGAAVTGYLNGVQEVTGAASTVKAIAGGLSFGSAPTPASYFPGSLDLVVIWNRALAADEVRIRYAHPWGLFRPDSFEPAWTPTGNRRRRILLGAAA